MNKRRSLIGFALFSLLLALAPLASAQPPNWEDQFTGWYGDSENQMPPGFPPYSTTNPFRTIEKVIAPLLQPWAAARKDATIFEIEEGGSFCRPTGLFLRHQNRGFQLLVSPGRITMAGTQLPGNPIRRIYLNGDHLKFFPLPPPADSVERWEGDTLATNPIGFVDTTSLSLEGSAHPSELH